MANVILRSLARYHDVGACVCKSLHVGDRYVSVAADAHVSIDDVNIVNADIRGPTPFVNGTMF